MMLVLLFCLSQAQRAALPDPAVQKEKERLIREVFSSDYARKAPADRIALARKLLRQGSETLDDAAAQYTMFHEAADLATSAGDPTAAIEAIGAMAKVFEVDGPKLKLGALSAIGQDTRSVETARVVAEQLLKVADEADASEQPETAEKAAAAAVPAARKAKDVTLALRAEGRLRTASDLKQRLARLATARETLLADPSNPAANLELGQYECFIKGNWEAGLPLLAKGSNEALKMLALRDLSRPEEPREQVGLGDAWKERAEKESGPKTRIQERAMYWYEQAYPLATGLLKIKLEKTVASLKGSVAPGAAKARAAAAALDGLVAWWRLDEGTGSVAEDSSGNRLQGKIAGSTQWVPGKIGKALRLQGINSQVVVADAPSLRITGDLTLALWIRKDEQQDDWARLIGKGDHNNRNYGLFAGGRNQQGQVLFQQWSGPMKEIVALTGQTKLQTGTWYHLAAVVRGDDTFLYVDGRLDASGKRTGTPVTSADPLTLGSADFHQPFPGILDDVRVYQRALTEADIQTLATVK